LDLIKYDPDQPRVPAGSGQSSGEWTSGGSAPSENGSFKPTVTISEANISQPSPAANAGTALPAAAISASGETLDITGGFGEALFTAGEDSAFLAGLAALGATIGAGSVLGTIFIPSTNGHLTSEGIIPSDPSLHYALNNDEGVLRLTRQGAEETELVAVAQRGRDGIFFETETGIPIARSVGGSLVFDAASLANEDEGENEQKRVRRPDHFPMPRSTIIHNSVLIPDLMRHMVLLCVPSLIKRRSAHFSLNDPATGKRVVFDDCRESDGTMIEAKGPGYARLLRSPYFYDKILPARWRRQAMKQAAAGGQRNLDWFFAERRAADRAKQIFRETESFQKINVIYFPAVMP